MGEFDPNNTIRFTLEADPTLAEELERRDSEQFDFLRPAEDCSSDICRYEVVIENPDLIQSDPHSEYAQQFKIFRENFFEFIDPTFFPEGREEQLDFIGFKDDLGGTPSGSGLAGLLLALGAICLPDAESVKKMFGLAKKERGSTATVQFNNDHNPGREFRVEIEMEIMVTGKGKLKPVSAGPGNGSSVEIRRLVISGEGIPDGQKVYEGQPGTLYHNKYGAGIKIGDGFFQFYSAPIGSKPTPVFGLAIVEDPTSLPSGREVLFKRVVGDIFARDVVVVRRRRGNGKGNGRSGDRPAPVISATPTDSGRESPSSLVTAKQVVERIRREGGFVIETSEVSSVPHQHLEEVLFVSDRVEFLITRSTKAPFDIKHVDAYVDGESLPAEVRLVRVGRETHRYVDLTLGDAKIEFIFDGKVLAETLSNKVTLALLSDTSPESPTTTATTEMEPEAVPPVEEAGELVNEAIENPFEETYYSGRKGRGRRRAIYEGLMEWSKASDLPLTLQRLLEKWSWFKPGDREATIEALESRTDSRLPGYNSRLFPTVEFWIAWRQWAMEQGYYTEEWAQAWKVPSKTPWKRVFKIHMAIPDHFFTDPSEVQPVIQTLLNDQSIDPAEFFAEPQVTDHLRRAILFPNEDGIDDMLELAGEEKGSPTTIRFNNDFDPDRGVYLEVELDVRVTDSRVLEPVIEVTEGGETVHVKRLVIGAPDIVESDVVFKEVPGTFYRNRHGVGIQVGDWYLKTYTAKLNGRRTPVIALDISQSRGRLQRGTYNLFRKVIPKDAFSSSFTVSRSNFDGVEVIQRPNGNGSPPGRSESSGEEPHGLIQELASKGIDGDSRTAVVRAYDLPEDDPFGQAVRRFIEGYEGMPADNRASGLSTIESALEGNRPQAATMLLSLLEVFAQDEGGGAILIGDGRTARDVWARVLELRLEGEDPARIGAIITHEFSDPFAVAEVLPDLLSESDWTYRLSRYFTKTQWAELKTGAANHAVGLGVPLAAAILVEMGLRVTEDATGFYFPQPANSAPL